MTLTGGGERTASGHVGSQAEVIDQALLRSRAGVVLAAAPSTVGGTSGAMILRWTQGYLGAVAVWAQGFM